MIIAKQKRDENIIEYILYMWQIEDLIRANNFNMKKIDQNIISQYKNLDADKTLEVRYWWENLVEMMKNEKKELSGHLQVNINMVNDANQLHIKLIKQPKEISYIKAFQAAIPMIHDFEMKSAAPFYNDIELCLTAIYSSYLLKLQKKEISEATTHAIKTFSRFLAILAQKYKLDSEGKLEID
ncbi:MAG: DUF4924 family protein [Marinilabiliaceae bacterium]|nr:DUF4924 family protein [Marinilabiliaceae bacterium]